MTARPDPTVETNQLFVFLRASHETLTDLGGKVMHALRADIQPDLLARWCEFESKLLSHLEAEERFVLPAFARVDREAAFVLLREHGTIREQVLELGVAIELHCARPAPFEHLVERLRTHAAQEEALLYRWASTMLDPWLAEAAWHHASTITPRHSR
jgi:Hemerythrin HHE cation binding domain